MKNIFLLLIALFIISCGIVERYGYWNDLEEDLRLKKYPFVVVSYADRVDLDVKGYMMRNSGIVQDGPAGAFEQKPTVLN